MRSGSPPPKVLCAQGQGAGPAGFCSQFQPKFCKDDRVAGCVFTFARLNVVFVHVCVSV